MIDPVLLRENPDLIKRSQELRGESSAFVDDAVAADAARRTAITAFEALRAEQNAFGKRVAKAPKEEKAALVAQAQELAARVKDGEPAARTTPRPRSPRPCSASATSSSTACPPAAKTTSSCCARSARSRRSTSSRATTSRSASCSTPSTWPRGAKVSGARFYFLKGVGARLELALMNMGLDRALAAGFTPLITPTLVRPEIMQGTGFLGAHSEEIYYLPDDDLYLTGTSEVALAGYHADEILDLSNGPLRYAGWSTCYRREAGSHGKDTRGIIRVHQFNKLEMFSYVDPADAEAEHERLLGWQEGMLQALGLGYRVIDTAAGDLGSSAARKYDVEAWVPTQDAYRELTSTSNCTTFQARRLDIRYRTESGKTAPVATLNGTLATTRWIVAILETHQQADGSVVVPEALRGYLGGLEVLEPVAR